MVIPLEFGWLRNEISIWHTIEKENRNEILYTGASSYIMFQ